jgi:hypothetical protein
MRFVPEFPRLNQSRRGTRTNKLAMGAPMLARWKRNPGKTYIENLIDLVNWMSVETANRWASYIEPKSGKHVTFCDEYADDFLDQLFHPHQVCFAASIWWTPASIEKMETTGAVLKIRWPDTVISNGARGLNTWLKDWSPSYGWILFDDEESFYTWLNSGANVVGVISTPKHVSIALPDAVKPQMMPQGTIPLQTQAGASNKMLFRTSSWYKKNTDVVFAGIAVP